MKPAAAVLCLLVTVTTVSAGPQVGEDTGTPRAAHTLRVREVRFAGDPAFEPSALKKVLQELESQRVIPGIWTRRPLYETRAVEADLARLRSFYFSQGYFDARIGIGSVTVDGSDAILTFEVQSGPKYLVRHIEIDGINDERGAPTTDSNGESLVDTFCTCLFDARRIAESQGRLDFAVELEISHTDGPALPNTGREWVDVSVGPVSTLLMCSRSCRGRCSGARPSRLRRSVVGRIPAPALHSSGLIVTSRGRESIALRDLSGSLLVVHA